MNMGLNPKISLANLAMLNQNWVRLIGAQQQPLGGHHVILFFDGNSFTSQPRWFLSFPYFLFCD